jgi:tRNA-splicing ligase RtcB
MQVIHEGNSVPVKAWVDGVEFDQATKEQVLKVARMPMVFRQISLMPDCHLGVGSTVGSVIATKSAIIPAIVGSDIGCGGIAVKTSLTASHLPDNLDTLRFVIEQAIPVGRTDGGGSNDRGSWGDPPEPVLSAWAELEPGYRKIVDKHGKISHRRVIQQLGSLGTGNHFIEKCVDNQGCVWLMLHSGSRGVGNAIGTYFTELAKKDMRKWFINLPDENLAYFPEGTDHFDDYVEAMLWAQEYARVNRVLMMDMAIAAIQRSKLLPKFSADLMAVNAHHNFASKESHFKENVWVARKGAVRARKDELGLIFGSMGTKSYVVRGKGNPESFMTCSHGAGRKMSRTQARNTIPMKDFEKAMEGVSSRRDKDVLDEAPQAYKAIEKCLAAQADLVDVVYELKQVICVKG